MMMMVMYTGAAPLVVQSLPPPAPAAATGLTCARPPAARARAGRDEHLCRGKYGKDWDKYKSIVRYRLIPYIY